MTIQIDDANYGGLVGSCLVGAVRVEEPATFQTVTLPIGLFPGDAYARGDYLRAAADAAWQLVTAVLDVPADEEILVCQGYIFSLVQETLTAAGYTNVRCGKIGEPMQLLIERFAADYLTGLGVPGITPGMPFGLHF